MKPGPTANFTRDEWIANEGPIGDGWNAGEFFMLNQAAHPRAMAPCLGWLNDLFGVFEANANTTLGKLRLSTLVHVGTGVPLAILDQPETAARAGDLIRDLAPWASFKPEIAGLRKWHKVFQEIQKTWLAADLIIAPAAVAESGATIWMARPKATPPPVDQAIAQAIAEALWLHDGFTPAPYGSMPAQHADMPLGRLWIGRHGKPPDPAKPWQGTFAGRPVGFYSTRDEGKAALLVYYGTVARAAPGRIQ